MCVYRFINARMRVWRPMLRRQKEEQERRQRSQQLTEGTTATLDYGRPGLPVEDSDSSDCDTSVKGEESEACEVRARKVESAEVVPRLP